MFHGSLLFIQEAEFNSSGRYYCIYSMLDHHDKNTLFVLKNFSLILYDCK